MTNTEIKYLEFIKFVHQQFESEISLEEVTALLHLEEDYNKDSPASLGKSLVLNRLIFSGEKISGQEFIFDQKLYKGINVWIADNHKGKSTVFKVIKFALTGTDDIKSDIKNWIGEIILEFQVGANTFTCFIDKTGRCRGAMYSFGIERYLELRDTQKLETIGKEIEFEFKSQNQFVEKLQEFFFAHFSFYTLKYTHHLGSKEELGLTTAKLSWSTYFKSIYLESNNYEYLFFEQEKFGSQGRKIFEMILGLPLTYPINMLTMQSDHVSEEIGKLKLVDKSKIETDKSKRLEIENKYAVVTHNINLLRQSESLLFDRKPLLDEYNVLQMRINENRKRARIATDKYQAERAKINPLEGEITNLESDLRKINDEMQRLTKQEINVELYKEAGSFFSNLDIKTCPHCDVEVSELKKENERVKHVCALCGETSEHQRVDEAELQAKLVGIRAEKAGYTSKSLEIQKNISNRKEEMQNLETLVADLLSKLPDPTLVDADNERLKEIENEIETLNKEQNKSKELIEKKEGLIKEEAVLKFQLEEMAKNKPSENADKITQLSLKKAILDFALQALEKKRIHLNKDILTKLQQLILKEVHALGLSSIENIEISDKFTLIFTQNQVNVAFNDLTEGEKLRAKLAFYLSLIQLDIEHNLGRHPRFLIFDSPGNEEMIEEHLHGLSEMFKSVNQRFRDNLQIFVGSALREFSEITDAEKSTIKERNEFVF